ncbi:condensation domain-containing protein [Streptacidiphilus jiangxiensis]|uniref:Condensation domain-containing protein n=1 Tax=Streptacidiphilus jiangxiensis TaxID=235985 RepID=A0A1H7VMK2_STRJI|nr:condensation domain-containing protein [Streptacidiphilus jiangxiensis]SEM10390.1 Condensation domain-containing protein [Streptacidiphilus jiangxiensis]
MGTDEMYQAQEPSWAQRHRLGQIAGDVAAGVNRPSHPAALLRVRGPLDVAALERAWQRLQLRHHVLRCGFEPGTGRWRLDRPAEPTPVTVLPAAADPVRLLHEATDAPFDLEHGPLARLLLAETGDGLLFGLVTDHLVSDLWSVNVLMEDLTACYRQELGESVELPADDSLAFPQHVREQNAHLASDAGRALLTRLAEQLGQVGPIPGLRFDGFTGAPTAGYANPGVFRTAMPAELVAAVTDGARRTRMSKWSWIHAAVHRALYELGDQEAVGTTLVTANREAYDVRRTVGFLSGRVVIATERSASGSAGTFLPHFNRAAIRALDVSSAVPWGSIIERMEPDAFGAPSSGPYFSFNPQPLSLNRLFDDLGFTDCAVEPVAAPGLTLDAALAVLPIETPSGISVVAHHRVDWYPAPAVEALWAAVERTLGTWARELDTWER